MARASLHRLFGRNTAAVNPCNTRGVRLRIILIYFVKFSVKRYGCQHRFCILIWRLLVGVHLERIPPDSILPDSILPDSILPDSILPGCLGSFPGSPGLL